MNGQARLNRRLEAADAIIETLRDAIDESGRTSLPVLAVQFGPLIADYDRATYGPDPETAA